MQSLCISALFRNMRHPSGRIRDGCISLLPTELSHMYPATFLLSQPAESRRLLLILRPFLFLPHLFWSALFGMAAGVVQFFSFWAIVITGRHPRGLWNVLEAYFRYSMLVQAWAMYLTDRYPPFSGNATTAYPIGVRVEFPARMSRATVFFRFLLLVPHLLYALGFSFFYGIIQFLTWWTILFLGRMTDGQYNIARAFFVYTGRLTAYSVLLVDEYPPFNGAQPRAAETLFATPADPSATPEIKG